MIRDYLRRVAGAMILAAGRGCSRAATPPPTGPTPVVSQWVQTHLADRPDLLAKLSG